MWTEKFKIFFFFCGVKQIIKHTTFKIITILEFVFICKICKHLRFPVLIY